MPNPFRIVVVGDIHGNYKGLINNLIRAKVIDNNLNWISNNTQLVQIGDIFDRGNESLKSLNFLYTLREFARSFDGDIHFLFGNHEEMLLHGQSWYAVLENGYKDIKEYMNDLSPEGKIGKRIIDSHHLGIILNKILFIHGGFTCNWLKKYYPNNISLSELNLITKKIFTNENRFHPIFNVGYSRGGNQIPGPLWADYFDDICIMEEEEVDFVLNYFKVNRMIVGHSPILDNKIDVSYNNKVINIDVGLTQMYGGNEAVLIIENENIKAVYPNKEELIN